MSNKHMEEFHIDHIFYISLSKLFSPNYEKAQRCVVSADFLKLDTSNFDNGFSVLPYTVDEHSLDVVIE